ncbi:MAG TPA: NAD-dependent epimerase/dehydratase family protein [Candidatus Acidoferrum sp.]|nr:NAD-dependent epimerase/dehydratase family protein [Candidatus Acidoferrum sp.]
MKVLITGANGFVGQGLARRLLKQPVLGRAVTGLTLLSRRFEQPPVDPRVRLVKGDMADAVLLQDALNEEPEVIFHLACVPGAVSEPNFELGKHINLDANIALLEMLRTRKWQATHVPRLVFTSSVAVYGKPLSERGVDESLRAVPGLSYGAQKIVGEVLIADYSRRGWLDGRSVRLPGIVSRPVDDAGHASRFLSDLIRFPTEGKPVTCPTTPDAKSWFLSRSACIDNLIHAAELTTDQLNPARQWQLPAQHLSMQSIVEGLVKVHGEGVRKLVSFEPNATIQDIYASYPPLITTQAESVGFRHDGDVESLVRRALLED